MNLLVYLQPFYLVDILPFGGYLTTFLKINGIPDDIPSSPSNSAIINVRQTKVTNSKSISGSFLKVIYGDEESHSSIMSPSHPSYLCVLQQGYPVAFIQTKLKFAVVWWCGGKT